MKRIEKEIEVPEKVIKAFKKIETFYKCDSCEYEHYDAQNVKVHEKNHLYTELNLDYSFSHLPEIYGDKLLRFKNYEASKEYFSSIWIELYDSVYSSTHTYIKVSGCNNEDYDYYCSIEYYLEMLEDHRTHFTNFINQLKLL